MDSENAVKPAIADLSPLMQGLACAALQPGLRSILVFDSAAGTLRMAAERWAEMLAVTTGKEVRQVYLGPTDTEETLWGNLAPTPNSAAQAFVWKSGVLGDPADEALRLVVIPDLTRLSLAAARACIALMGTEVAHLERHGQQARWRSQLCWIAGCPRSQVQFLSPHLLDRFALRLTGQDVPVGDRTQVLADWLATVAESPKPPMLSKVWRDRLQTARQQRPEIAAAAYARGLTYWAEAPGPGMRRELALLRLAQAQAQWAGLGEVTVQHVDRAAQLIGLKLPAPVELPPPVTQSPKEPTSFPEPTPHLPTNPQPIAAPPAPTPKPEVYQSDSAAEFPPAPMELGQSPRDPYPEDHTPMEREAASLRLPLRRFRTARVGRGAIVGIEPATVPQDIAWVSTLLEAAKYQAIRQRGAEARLVVRSPDLRRYRRAVVPEQMLMLVLDHTCLRDCQWQAAVLPYLQWAYVERASVCLVQVGAAIAGQELQAERVTAQSVLVPRLRTGLESGAGMATPLAHGLDLALQTLRHALQHGRSAVQQAVLVVVSDGRGNVPLECSRTNQKPTQPVKRRGIEDALAVAEQIRELKSVEAVVLNPQPKHYADLPVKLALALGAKVADIPLLQTWEVED